MFADISIKQAETILANNFEVRLIDVRTAEEYRQGRIAGSINIPLSRLGDIRKLIPNKNTAILVYCKSGGRSAQAKKTLLSMGYQEVKNIGGIRGWKLIN